MWQLGLTSTPSSLPCLGGRLGCLGLCLGLTWIRVLRTLWYNPARANRSSSEEGLRIQWAGSSFQGQGVGRPLLLYIYNY